MAGACLVPWWSRLYSLSFFLSDITLRLKYSPLTQECQFRIKHGKFWAHFVDKSSLSEKSVRITTI